MNDDIQKFLNDHLGLVEFRLKPIEKGGSDRIFSRLLQSNGKSFIFMHYGTEVEENTYWTEINRFLNDLNIPVPRIIAYDQRQRFLLLEDLGEIDVYMLRSLPWHKRRPFYLKALSDIHRLHRVLPADVPAHLQLARGYDRSLYQWEHDYFRENFVEAVCKIDLSGALIRDWAEESGALIDRLQKIPPCLIHRDFQSQNLVIKDDRPVFIDFQGMRQGNLFYDLGSLICDPYVTLSPDERNELIAFYYRIMEPAYSLDQFTDYFWEGAAQRLMQALGAYGFLGLKKNKPDFLKHTATGIKNLVTATSRTGNLPVLNDLARTCMIKLASRPG
ncbi:MAG: phosphotransferase [Deltaproteobacteria bacterium]